MAKTTLSEARRKQLERLGKSTGAKSFGEWLAAQEGSEDGAARLAARAKTKREAVGYGAAGERLLAGGLADDGYAAYLRHAAREARSEREMALEAERESRDLAALRGYADYLEGLRAERGKSLVSLAEELVSAGLTGEEAERRISLSEASPEAEAALYAAYRYEGSGEIPSGSGSGSSSSSKKRKEVLAYLMDVQIPYARAYRYCLEQGFSESEAALIAKEAQDSYSAAAKKLHALLGK